MMNISESLKALGDFKRFSEIVSRTEVGADRRWEFLQKWLADHPRYRRKLYHCLSLTPAEAVPYLCRELELDYDGLRMLDPTGQLLQMAHRAIEQFQILYKERAGSDSAAFLNPSPKSRKVRK